MPFWRCYVALYLEGLRLGNDGSASQGGLDLRPSQHAEFLSLRCDPHFGVSLKLNSQD